MTQRAAAEFAATAALLIAVVGSGIAAERMAGGNAAIALLANALATGCALFVLILAVAPISGSHMNPLVTLVAAFQGDLKKKDVLAYWIAQGLGAVAGVYITHLMFDLPVLQTSTHVRTGFGQWLAEAVAVIGLLAVIWRCVSYGVPVVAGAVAAYITGAYWFTASTSFANPAVTLARALTDTFAGVRPSDTLGFIIAQLAGLACAVALSRLFKRP